MRLGIKKNKEDMRGLFFIIKGQHDEHQGLSAYNPELDTTVEWYVVMDKVCFNTIACSSNIQMCLDSVETAIKKHKTAKEYFRVLGEYSTEDYYTTHYEGGRPYTPDQVSELMGKGKRARVSPAMKEMYKEIYDLYGDYYADLVEEMEDKAYSSGAFITPYQRSKRSLRRSAKIKNTGKGLTKVKDKEVTPEKSKVLSGKKKLRPRKLHQ